MTTYDPALIERLVAEARAALDSGLPGGSGVYGQDLAAMADQLEAAKREVERMSTRTDHLQRQIADGCTGIDNEIVLMLRRERDHEREKFERTCREWDLARTRIADLEAAQESSAIAAEADRLAAERDALRAEVESLAGWCRYALANWAPEGSFKAEAMSAEVECVSPKSASKE